MNPPDLRIVVRDIDYDYLAPLRENRFWHRNGPGTTHFLNALQAIFPEGGFRSRAAVSHASLSSRH